MPDHRHGFDHRWVRKAGLALGGATLLFFMVLVVASIFGYSVPQQGVYLINIVLSLGAALSTAFLAGDASVRGRLPILSDSPLTLSAGGGIAVLVIMLALTNTLNPSSNGRNQNLALACPSGMQPYTTPSLGFGFCYPRSGWEIDDKALAVSAADIFIRQSINREVGIHFHVSVIPQDFVRNPEVYSERVADTWRGLDGQLTISKGAIGGVSVFEFTLRAPIPGGRERPTEVTHLYMDDERLLEVFLMWFDDSEQSVIDTLRQIRSSIVLLSARG